VLVRRGRVPGLPSKPAASTALVSLSVLVVCLAIVALAYPQKNMRFLSPIVAPIHVLAAVSLVALVETVRTARGGAPRWVAVAGVAVLLVVAAALEDRQFVHFFIERGVPDLATPWLMR